MLITARKDFPPNDLKELIAWLKANPDKATAGDRRSRQRGACGAASISRSATDTRFQFVPYRGGGAGDPGRGRRPRRPDVQRGSSALPYVLSQQIKALRGLGQDPLVRGARHPDHATSSACRACTFRSGTALWVPKGTPQEIVTSSTPRWSTRSPTRRCAAAHRSSARRFPARQADAGSASCLPQGRDREVVAHHQGGEYQAELR